MEIHPVLEGDVNPGDNLWYVVSAFGDRPSLRVGHTAVYNKGMSLLIRFILRFNNICRSNHKCALFLDGNTNQVVIIGGANPSELFQDVHILDLKSLSWNMVSPEGFEARYEHISYLPSSQPTEVYVLSGANQEANVSTIQSYNIQKSEWSTIKVAGSHPAPRTHHTTAAAEDCVYLFSGGKSGTDPVQDRQVYSFNAKTNSWSSLAVSGESPAPRHGHTLCAYGRKVICFGGMSGAKFYNDLHTLDLDKNAWCVVKVKKRSQPEPRASHAAVVHGRYMYVFGGLSKEGMALDDLWRLDLTTMQWYLMKIEG